MMKTVFFSLAIILSPIFSTTVNAQDRSYDERNCRYGPPTDSTVALCNKLFESAKTSEKKAAILDDRARANKTFGDVTAALADAERATQLAPNISKYWITLGDMRLRNDKIQEGISAYTHAQKLDPSNANAVAGIAEARLFLNEFEDAIKLADKAALMNSALAEPLVVKAKALISIKRHGEAIKAATTAIDLKNAESARFKGYAEQMTANDGGRYTPESLEATWMGFDAIRYHEIRAKAYFLNEDYTKALSDYNIALAPISASSQGYEGRANVHAALENKEAALADYKRALEIDSTNTEANFGRGILFLKDKQYDEAIAEFDAVISANPKATPSLLNRGAAWHLKGEKIKAVGDFTQAINVWPQFGLAYLRRGLVYLEMDMPKESLSDLDNAIKFGYADAEVFSLKAKAYFLIKKYTNAVSEISKAIEIDNVKSAYLNERCYYRALGKFELSLAEIDCLKSLSIERHLDTLDSTAFLYLVMGANQKAITYYSSVLSIESQNATALYGRGLARKRAGQKKNGESDIALASKLNPSVAEEFVGY
jgi:tetratricopeptide (TPR) repeat protein